MSWLPRSDVGYNRMHKVAFGLIAMHLYLPTDRYFSIAFPVSSPIIASMNITSRVYSVNDWA